MMKPINHHFSGPAYITGEDAKHKWHCTLAYNIVNKRLGIAVVGKEDQFCRKTGAHIAFSRTLDPELTDGQYSYQVSSDEELKEVLKKFRAIQYRTQLLALIFQYFPSFAIYYCH